MPLVFATSPGSTVSLLSDNTQAVYRPLFTLANNPLSWKASKSIVTRVSFSSQTNQQFLHSLGGDIYIYVFGDRVGEMTVSGMAMAIDCDNANDGQHGIEKVYSFYQKNKLSKLPTPLAITIGQSTVLQGFMGGFSTDTYDHQLGLMQYQLSMFLLPEKP